MKFKPEVGEFWLPKEGNSDSEYEDASRIDEANQRFAVADGATETSFSGLWAKILVDAFIEERLPDFQQENLLPLVREWEKQIAEPTRSAPLPWYAEEKLKKGAFSSLLGLKIEPEGKWDCRFIGDSCLFQVRNGTVIRQIPYSDPTEFHNRPVLISTNVSQNAGLTLNTESGDWQIDDYFFLMTDALAECFLSKNVAWRSLSKLKRQSAFQAKVKNLRTRKRCRNDDTTLIRIHIIPATEDNEIGLA